MFDKYGRVTGYGQMAPGRDVDELDIPGRPGRPRIGEAIGSTMPVKPPTATFKGAQQTIGAPPAIDQLFGNANEAGQTDPYASPGRREPGGITGGADVRDIHNQSSSPIDSSSFNTKGFAAPQYLAQNFGSVAPGGWDQTKWSDPNYQDPKYVVGRIEMEASGGDGYFDTPEEKQRAIDNILKAYPNATYDGKDHIDFHDGGAPVDVVRAAGSARPGISFAPDEPGGGAGNPMGSFSPIQSAILGVPPGQQNEGESYAARLRAQIMAALNANPELAAIAQSRGLGF